MAHRPVQYAKFDKTARRSSDKRRFDSIARLLNTNAEVCTAVCLNTPPGHEPQILLANNTGNITELQKGYINFFRKCALRGHSFTTTPAFKVESETLLAASIAQSVKPGIHLQKILNVIDKICNREDITGDERSMLEKEKMGIEERLPPGSRLEPTKLQLLKQYLEKKTFDTDKLKAEYNKEHNTKAQAITKKLTKDINKVVHSLTAIDKSGFEDSTKAAFAKPFLFIGSKDNKLHAEMKILDYLDVTGQIDTKNPENIQDIEPIYIGISKMCCLNCEATVQALNQYPSLKIIEIDASDYEQEQAATEKHATRPQAKTSIAALETADQTPRTPRRTTEHSAAAAATKESPIQTRGAHLQGFPHWT